MWHNMKVRIFIYTFGEAHQWEYQSYSVYQLKVPVKNMGGDVNKLIKIKGSLNIFVDKSNWKHDFVHVIYKDEQHLNSFKNI